MAYTFESLRVWQSALDYDERVCSFAAALPAGERYGLAEQLRRASMSVALNIAEGTTSQTDREKHRFLGYAIRSLVETIAAQRIAHRRGYPVDAALVAQADGAGEELYRQLQAFRTSVRRRIRQSRRPQRPER